MSDVDMAFYAKGLRFECTGCGECAEICPAEAIVPLTELGS
jgi:ferredoxin